MGQKRRAGLFYPARFESQQVKAIGLWRAGHGSSVLDLNVLNVQVLFKHMNDEKPTLRYHVTLANHASLGHNAFPNNEGSPRYRDFFDYSIQDLHRTKIEEQTGSYSDFERHSTI